MIMSIIAPDAGRAEVMGSSALAMKDRIGYLPEERGLYRKMKVGEFVGYMARLKGVPAAGLARRIDDWLERLELPGVARWRSCSRILQCSRPMKDRSRRWARRWWLSSPICSAIITAGRRRLPAPTSLAMSAHRGPRLTR
jgi:hypothetical protein